MTRLKKIKRRNNLPRLKDQYTTLRELHASRKNPILLKPGSGCWKKHTPVKDQTLQTLREHSASIIRKEREYNAQQNKKSDFMKHHKLVNRIGVPKSLAVSSTTSKATTTTQISNNNNRVRPKKS
jgi:hypothetical protein